MSTHSLSTNNMCALLCGIGVFATCLRAIETSVHAGTLSNGNGINPVDVGIWYETLYDATMWSLGSAPYRSIKFLPLCPNPIVYSGAWVRNPAVTGFINSDCHTSKTPGDFVEFTFTGTGIQVIGDIGTDHGQVDIYIDDTTHKVTTANAYSTTHLVQQVLYANTALPSATHTLRVQIATKKDSRSSGYVISLDAFAYTFSWIDINDANSTYTNEPSTVLTYDTNWHSTQLAQGARGHYWGNYSGYWQDNFTASTTASSGLTFTFAGTGLKVVGDRGTNYGWGTIAIATNGVAYTNVAFQCTNSSADPQPQHQQQLCEITGLSPGTNTASLTNTSPNRLLVIDEFKYLPNSAKWTTNNDSATESYHQYVSGDSAILDYHLKQLASTKIGFVLFDITNGGLGWDSNGIPNANQMGGYDCTNRFFITNLQLACSRIKAWNDRHAWKMKYAVAVGTWWASAGQCRPNLSSEKLLENQAIDVYTNYCTNPAYGGPDNYYLIDGRPLLVVHDYFSSATNVIDTITKAPSLYPYANKFALRPSGVRVYPGWYGWPAPADENSVKDPHGEVAFIAPGHNSHTFWVVTRTNGGVHYSDSWNKTLAWAPRPRIILLGSFNEYLEDNALWTADTTYLDQTPIYIGNAANSIPRDEQWRGSDQALQPWLYWDLTATNVTADRPTLPANGRRRRRFRTGGRMLCVPPR
jgi:hypothetical protein